jgi:hypothetical protein
MAALNPTFSRGNTARESTVLGTGRESVSKRKALPGGFGMVKLIIES